MKRTLLVCAIVLTSLTSGAQVSFQTAIDLALRNNPRVKMAEAEVERTRSILAEAKDVYIPSLTAGSGLGYTYGFPVGTPTLYNFTVQSLVFDQSQFNYIRAARKGMEAANLNLQDIRQQVAEDAALTYIALDNDLQRSRTLEQQSSAAERLVDIVQQRLDAGQDTAMELTRSRISSAQVRLRRIQVANDIHVQRIHLARVTGLPADTLTTDTASIPAFPSPASVSAPDTALSPAVQAAYKNADSKLQQAFGDKRRLYRPQIGFAAQYARFASFNNYKTFYCQKLSDGSTDPNCNLSNNISFGIQLTWPLFDFARRAKARESIAEAVRSRHEADYIRDQFLDGRLKAATSASELQVRTEIASLDRDLAQQQLDVVRTEITAGNPNGQPVTPKDEQNALVQERQKYLDYLDADFQLRQAELSLLRNAGQLESWIKSSVRMTPAGQP
ncbi:MAG: TolC family protein [Acidobacteria bacterium]|nr:TolC family protein [Acidobacteriota bacterium]